MKLSKKRYFTLIREFSIAEFKIGDQCSILGFLWSFLNPLIMSTILFLLFKKRMSPELGNEYFIYILIGTVMWNFFTMATTSGLSSLARRGEMIRNVAFPKEILVYSDVGTFAIQHLFELLSLFLFIIIFSVGFSAHAVFLLFIIAIEILFIIGICLFLSCICVYARDIKHIWNVVTKIGFFTVPIFYDLSAIPAEFKWIVKINPMSQIIMSSRDALFYHRLPSLLPLCSVAVLSIFVFMLGYRFFKLFEYKIVERV